VADRPGARPDSACVDGADVAITAGALVTVGGVREAVVESGVLWGPPGVISRAFEVARRLTVWPWERQWPSGRLPPVVRYVHDCTNPGDRLLVTWFAPEYYVFARRGFAAGQATFLPGYYTSPDDQAQAVRRLEAQSVPIALIDRARHASFRSEFPGIERYVSARFAPVGEFDAGEGHRVMILADRERAAPGCSARRRDVRLARSSQQSA
jgi:hypothetical protein